MVVGQEEHDVEPGHVATGHGLVEVAPEEVHDAPEEALVQVGHEQRVAGN